MPMTRASAPAMGDWVAWMMAGKVMTNNAKLDLMLYVVSLENDGKTDKEIIEEVISYNKSKHFNGLDELTRTNLIKSTLKTLKR